MHSALKKLDYLGFVRVVLRHRVYVADLSDVRNRNLSIKELSIMTARFH